jgi:hypothetical protein
LLPAEICLEANMQSKFFVLAIALSALGASAFAACAKVRALVPDGRINESLTVDGTGAYFLFTAKPGHSYSVELMDIGHTGSLNVFFNGVADPNNSCPTADGTGLTHTEQSEPLSLSDLHRVSFTPTAAGNNFYGASATTSSATPVTFKVSDTTLYNPRWSTYGGFITQYGFQNTTSSAVSVTVTLTTTLGGAAAVSPLTFSIPANSQVFKTVGPSGDFVVAASHAGFAIATTNGPPGAIKADAYFEGPGVIVPSDFKSVRE